MKLHLAGGAGLHLFNGYGAGYVVVNGVRHERSLVVLPDAVDPWAAVSFESLTAEHFAPLAGRGLEVLVLGTGARLRFPRPAILAPLTNAGLGVEVMDTQAACRTYNILVGEGRRAAAAVIVEAIAAPPSPASS